MIASPRFLSSSGIERKLTEILIMSKNCRDSLLNQINPQPQAQYASYQAQRHKSLLLFSD